MIATRQSCRQPTTVQRARLVAALAATLGLASAALAQTGSHHAPADLGPAPDPETAPGIVLNRSGLQVRIALPDARSGFYRGTRFDWSGMITRVTMNGSQFYGPWFDALAPDIHDFADLPSGIVVNPLNAGTGPAEEFANRDGETVPGYNAAPVGGTFIKIGVGRLRKPDIQPYDHFRPYAIVDGGRWTVRRAKDRITFIQRLLPDATGFGYEYEKTVSLAPGGVMTIAHRLRNIGSKPIDTQVYNHNLARFDDAGIGPGVKAEFPFPITGSAPPPALARVEGNTLRYIAPLQPGDRVQLPAQGEKKAAPPEPSASPARTGPALPCRRIRRWCAPCSGRSAMPWPSSRSRPSTSPPARSSAGRGATHSHRPRRRNKPTIGRDMTMKHRSKLGFGAIVGAASMLLLFTQSAHSDQPAPPQARAPIAEPLDLAVIKPQMACAALTSTDVSQTVGAVAHVDAASIVDEPGTAPYCSAKVSVDNYAHFELHLPTDVWTQRLLFGGGPGAQTASGMKLDRFATVSWEDLGRRDNEDLLANDYRGEVNAGYRGMHLQVLAAKALIARFYGRKPRFSYYNACSNPAREGMIEAQRFPLDFDGIGAGCPPINTTVNNGLFTAWNVMTNTGPDGAPILTADKLPILHKAVLDQCDAADGATDGIVSLPYACHPDIAVVECRPGQEPATCLTPAQIHVAQEIYRGAHDKAGRKLTPGGVLPGSELAWTATIVPGNGPFNGPEEARKATEKAIRSHYSLPALPASWKLKDLTFDHASFEATTKYSYLHDGTNPDLSGYAKAGHKLILWMALADTNVMVHQSVLYYQALQSQMGEKTVDGFVRFYVLPGVYHCGGGDGPVISDLLEPLMLWVERGIAPAALAGVHRPRGPGMEQGAGPRQATLAAPDLTRPIYPYPYIAQYTGKGDVRVAANFVKGAAHPAPAGLGNWPGAGFYKPGYMRWCTATATSIDCTTTRQ
ncbi:tannase/feruloyl esterase family alpha/beta hydrolase [Novosphingobium sp. 9]|uniref:tannase/feruloyl esterase family alpha/beta hydrolase n=1 Tax=Novosphingobium sp. 9 TaxID=2025349 RepID=UPI0021B5C690|nr:tannase/feruloyl esterase family alpha/beta hydrolase [Novosphingobium sp. 9]